VPVDLTIVEGQTSWAVPFGEIRVSTFHADGDMQHLRSVLAHEFGHLIAFRYGSWSYNGAAPEGWPAYSERPDEAWADCVARATTGIAEASWGLPPCEGQALSWTQQWLTAGPGAHPATR
jgi:hypothetical protein